MAKINLKALETMLFLWASMKDKEKVADSFLIDFAETEEMKAAYDEEYNTESLRKVLSSILNREKLNSPTKKEGRFWNYNMWMLEDPEVTQTMLSPIRTLNISEYPDKEVIFYPGQLEEFKVIGDRLFINFFRIKTDWEGKVSLEDKTVEEYVREKLAVM